MTASVGLVSESDSPWVKGLTGTASWVLFFEFSDIVDFTVDNHPVQSSIQWNGTKAAGKFRGGAPTSSPPTYCVWPLLGQSISAPLAADHLTRGSY